MTDHDPITADFAAFAEHLGNVTQNSAAVQFFARGIAQLDAKAQTGELSPTAHQGALQALLDAAKTELVAENLTTDQRAVAAKSGMTPGEYARAWREVNQV